jgi:hypothetical protein
MVRTEHSGESHHCRTEEQDFAAIRLWNYEGDQAYLKETDGRRGASGSSEISSL